MMIVQLVSHQQTPARVDRPVVMADCTFTGICTCTLYSDIVFCRKAIQSGTKCRDQLGTSCDIKDIRIWFQTRMDFDVFNK